MEINPLELANSFATIVGLLSTFVQSRSATSANTTEEFLEWLEAHGHDLARRHIQANQELLHAVTNLLTLRHDELLGRFTVLDTVLAQLASKIDGFAPLALNLLPNIMLADQAVRILRRFVDSGSEKMIYHRSQGAIEASLTLFNTGEWLEISDPRCLDDDLATLSELGLIRTDSASGKTMVLRPTRLGLSFIASLSAP